VITTHSRRPSVVPPPSHLNLSRRSPSTDCPQLTCTPQPSRIISALTCRTRRLGVSSSGLFSQSPLTQHTQHQATSIRPDLGRDRLPDATRCLCCMFPGFMLVAQASSALCLLDPHGSLALALGSPRPTATPRPAFHRSR
jgi:hypothetical protein